MEQPALEQTKDSSFGKHVLDRCSEYAQVSTGKSVPVPHSTRAL